MRALSRPAHRPLTERAPEYVRAYTDELDTCIAGLDRLHPRWRDRVPFDGLPPRECAEIKRLLLRWHQIMCGRADHGIQIGWRYDAHGRPTRPYATSIAPRYDRGGTPVYGEEHVQILSAPLLAERLGLPWEDVESALDAYAEATREGRIRGDRDPRRWVREHLQEGACDHVTSH